MMSNQLGLLSLLCLVNLCSAYECYTSNYGGVFCRYPPYVYYSSAGLIAFCLILAGCCCCCYYYCAETAALSGHADEAVYVVHHRCQNCGAHCQENPPHRIVVMPSKNYASSQQASTRSCGGGPTGSTYSSRLSSTVSNRGG